MLLAYSYVELQIDIASLSRSIERQVHTFISDFFDRMVISDKNLMFPERSAMFQQNIY